MSLPWLDLDSAREKAAEIRKEKEAAVTNLEQAIKKAAESKRSYRKVKGQAYAIALADGTKSVTSAAEIAKAKAADAEFQAELDAGMVTVAKERLEQAKEDLWSLRHFSERSDALERWGGGGNLH